MAKRLTEKEKYEILKSFKSGKSIDLLSEDYNCNKLTITRNLKKSLGELQYKELINKNKSTGRKSKDDILSNINLNNEVSKKVSVTSQILEANREDSDFSPLPNCFLIVDKLMRIYLFCDLKKIDAKFKKKTKLYKYLKD